MRRMNKEDLKYILENNKKLTNKELSDNLGVKISQIYDAKGREQKLIDKYYTELGIKGKIVGYKKPYIYISFRNKDTEKLIKVANKYGLKGKDVYNKKFRIGM